MKKAIMIIAMIVSLTSSLIAYTSFVGFSGAPTSNGTCTESCHAQNAIEASCVVTGFPSNYEAGEEYMISVYHTDGPSICQFNCSVRSDETNEIAGELSAELNTAVYSASNESNGIHWASTFTDSGTFIWTAPQAHTGSVTLYWAGLQGTRASGTDQQFTFQANEEPSSVDFLAEIPDDFRLEQNYPNPFNQTTSINIYISKPGNAIFEISNLLGQSVYRVIMNNTEPGHYTIYWDGLNDDGTELPSGMYFYQLRTSEGSLTRKMTILR